MAIFLTLPTGINIGSYAALAVVDPGSFRNDKADQAPALYLAVGNSIKEEEGISSCDLYRIDIHFKNVNKIATLPFGLVSGLSYDPLADELLLIDSNLSNGNKIFRINYSTGNVKDYIFTNYGKSNVLETESRFPFQIESGFLILHSNPSRPLNKIDFRDEEQIIFERRNLFYYTYYPRESQYYYTKQNEYSFLISSQTPGSSSVLTFKTIKSNLFVEDKPSPMASDLLNDKFIYRAIDDKVFILDRISLKTLDQKIIDEPSIVSLAFWRNTFYTIHKGSSSLLEIPLNESRKLHRLNSFIEESRIKPSTSTNIHTEVTDEKYNPLSNITISSKILVDQGLDNIVTTCQGNSSGSLVLQIIPDEISIRDPLSFDSNENLQFDANNFALTIEKTEDIVDENQLTDRMIILESIDIKDSVEQSPLMLQNFFNTIPTSTIFDSVNRNMSFWTPRFKEDILTIEFNEDKSVQFIEFILTKEDNNPFEILDKNNKIIYTTKENLGVLQKYTVLSFIKSPEAITNKISIKGLPGLKIYDIKIKISAEENLGSVLEDTKISDPLGRSSFVYTSNGVEGTELLKISAHNKNINNTSNTFLNNEIVKTNLQFIDIKVKQTAASILLHLKNPQTSFSYSTLKLVEPPAPRPVDALGGIIDYPDIPVIGNPNIIDSGSYITSITTSNNLIWVLSNGGSASIISTNPSADDLDFIITPNQQPIGAQNVNITITASHNFNFVTGTLVDFGPGITVNSIKILDILDTERPKLVANITVSEVTSLGPRDITISSGNNKVPPLKNKFEILPQSVVAVSPADFIATTSISPRFRSIFINSASLTSSLSWGPFIYMVDNQGYLTRSDNTLALNKIKLLEGDIKRIRLTEDERFIIGTEDGSFYEVTDIKDPLSFSPVLIYLQSIPRVLVDFEVFEDKIIAINKGIRKLDVIDSVNLIRTTDVHEISTTDLERIFLRDGRLFVSDIAGSLFELDLTNFSTVSALTIPGGDKITGIEIIESIIYISTEQGKLYSYGSQLELFQDYSEHGGIITMSKYYNTLQIGTEYGRFITASIE